MPPSPRSPSAAAFAVAEGAWALLLVLVPAALNPSGALAVEPLKTSLFRCLALVVGVAWLVGRLLGPRQAPAAAAQPIARAGLLLAAATTLSTLLSLDPALSFFGTYVRGMGLLGVAVGALLLVVGADLLRDARRRERLLTALLLGSAFPCLYAAAQWLGRDPLTWSGVTGLVSSLGSPTSLGGYLVLVMPFTAYRVLVYGRSVAAGAGARMAGAYALHLALLLFQAAVLVKASIRGPLLGLVVGALLFSFLVVRASPGARRSVAYVAVAAFVGAVLALALVAGGGQGLSFVRRFLAAADPSGSGSERLTVWLASAPLPLRDPLRALVGFGPEMQSAAFEQAETIARMPGNQLWDRAHNLLLDTWLTGGLLGVLALLLVVAVTWRGAWRALHAGDRQQTLPPAADRQHTPLAPGDRQRTLLAAAVLAALAAHLVEAMFAFHTVATGALFWTLLALAASLTPGPVAELGTRTPERGTSALPSGLAAAAAVCAGLLLLPALAAPAIADHLHGLAQRQGTARAAARAAEQASAWAPWVEEIPRYAGTTWQELGFRRADASGEAALGQAAADLEEAARRAPLDPYAHLRVARHYLAWSAAAPGPGDREARLEQAERACERALAAGPYRVVTWETCAEVAEARGAPDLATARKERARQLRPA